MSDERQQMVESALARRRRRRGRPLPVRVAQAIGGFALLLVSPPAVVVLPELGIPIVLIALRLLADEFRWAARAYAGVEWNWRRFKAWFRSRSPVLRALIVIAALAVAALLVYLLFAH